MAPASTLFYRIARRSIVDTVRIGRHGDGYYIPPAHAVFAPQDDHGKFVCQIEIGWMLSGSPSQSGHSGGGWCHKLTAPAGNAASHSRSFDQRFRPETLRTAIATAFLLPTSTTSRLPRVMPV